MTEHLTHLSRAEMFECMAAGGTAEQLAHVDACGLCSSEMQRTAARAAEMRTAISEWAESLQGPDTAFLQRIVARRVRRQRTRAVEVCTAVLLALLVPAAVVEERHAERVRRQADEVLLMQVDAALQESEPRAMQPLATLVSWREDGKQDSGQQEQPRTEEKK